MKQTQLTSLMLENILVMLVITVVLFVDVRIIVRDDEHSYEQDADEADH